MSEGFSADQELVNGFVLEAVELIDAASEDILELEESPDSETINRVFRLFHTIKGNSNMLGFEEMGSLAHKAEDLLSDVRNSTIELNSSMISLLLKAMDFLKEMIDDIKTGESTVNAGSVEQLKKNLEISAGKTVEKQVEEKPNTSQNRVQTKETVAIKAPTNLNILIAEDDFFSRNFMIKVLSKYGNCDIAANGQEALDAFVSAIESDDLPNYDLICMDIMMPNVDGMEAVKKIRQMEELYDITAENESIILMVTALDDPKTVVRSLYRCGATGYLVKPISKNTLESEIIRFFGKK